jgi:small subunit ribosomal protein S6
VRTYELVSLFRPDLDEEALGAAIERIHQRITEHGGSVKSTDRWGKRRTAFSIQKYRDGYYVLTIFTLDQGRVAPLRQTLGLHEDLLRFTVAAHRTPPAPAQPQATAAAPSATPAAPPATPAAPPAPAPSEATSVRPSSEGRRV